MNGADNNKIEKTSESRDSLIKGVNHQVVEVTKPTCEYFERVIFFVKPEFSQVSEGTLRERAGKIAPVLIRASLSRAVGAALCGAAAALLVSRFLM